MLRDKIGSLKTKKKQQNTKINIVTAGKEEPVLELKNNLCCFSISSLITTSSFNLNISFQRVERMFCS